MTAYYWPYPFSELEIHGLSENYWCIESSCQDICLIGPNEVAMNRR